MPPGWRPARRSPSLLGAFTASTSRSTPSTSVSGPTSQGGAASGSRRGGYPACTSTNTCACRPTSWPTPAPVALDHLDLTLIADGRHSVPTRVGVAIDGHTQEVAVPAIADGRAEGSTVTVRVPLAPQVGSRVRLTVLALREVKAVNYFSK